ncbi:MAG: hypothetical protein U0175_04000 [Caldilineaceae bacterium]
MTHQTQLETLTQINTDDILGAIGLGELRRGRGLVKLLCRPPAQRFARQVLDFDCQVGESGLAVASVDMLKTLHNQLVIQGCEHIPAHGPLFFLSNHPGLTDTIALFASIARHDLRVLAADRPFLRALRNTSRYLIYLDEQKGQNRNAVRQAVNHLKAEGALLTFPAGKIEPDPAVLPGAVEALQSWSKSIALFVRQVPTVRLVPVMVKGVLNPQAQRHPLRLLRRSQKDREWLAAMLQILIPAYQSVTVQVRFAPPLQLAYLRQNDDAVMSAVRASMQAMIEDCQ